MYNTHPRLRETEAEGVERMYGAEEGWQGESVDADLQDDIVAALTAHDYLCKIPIDRVSQHPGREGRRTCLPRIYSQIN